MKYFSISFVFLCFISGCCKQTLSESNPFSPKLTVGQYCQFLMFGGGVLDSLGRCSCPPNTVALVDSVSLPTINNGAWTKVGQCQPTSPGDYKLVKTDCKCFPNLLLSTGANTNGLYGRSVIKGLPEIVINSFWGINWRDSHSFDFKEGDRTPCFMSFHSRYIFGQYSTTKDTLMLYHTRTNDTTNAVVESCQMQLIKVR